MNRLLGVLAVAFAASVVALTAEGDSGTAAARVTLADTAPVTIRGSGFARSERVRLVVSSGRFTRTRRVIATRSGRIVATFPGLPFDRCNGFVARASGSEGSAASLKLPQPLCPPN